MREYVKTIRVRCSLLWLVLTAPSGDVLQRILSHVIAKLGPNALSEFLGSTPYAMSTVLNSYEVTTAEVAHKARELFDKVQHGLASMQSGSEPDSRR